MMASTPACPAAAMAPLPRPVRPVPPGPPRRRPLPPAPRAALASLALVAPALAGLGLVAPALVLAPALAEPPYPPATTFREVQLQTLSCSRENTAASCRQARALADPLLDHPRLSTSCKDALWSVRQRSVVAEGNSLERRDSLDRASRDVAAYCRQPYVPPDNTGIEKPSSKPFSLLSPSNP